MSRHWQRAGLDSRENLDTFKKLVSTNEISQSKLRNLNFVLTPPSSPKSLDRDQEICWDMTFLENLDSLSQSRLRVSQIYHISRLRFLNLSRFLILKYLKKSGYRDILINLEKSWQILKILTFLTKILKQPSLDWKVSILKISTEKKKVVLNMMNILDGFQKLVSTDQEISISIGLDCRDPQA